MKRSMVAARDEVSRALVGVVIVLGLTGGCQRPPDAARPVDAALPDGPSTVDLPVDAPVAVDCPSVDLGDGAGSTGWTVARNEGVDLHAVACAEGHVFVAGDEGTLLHRAPAEPGCGGFEPLAVPTDADLMTVSFAGLAYGVVAGKNPQIWESRDGGQSWEIALQCGTVAFTVFHSLHLHSPNQGYGAGVASGDVWQGAYKVYPGTRWICPGETFPNQVFYDVFRRQLAGWIVGDTDGTIYHTPDDWYRTFLIETGNSKPLRGVFVTEAMVGVAVGDDGIILRSDDGDGLEWSKVNFFGNADLWEVFFVDDDHGWAVGDGGTIVHTADAGQSWSYQLSPTTSRLESVCFTSVNDGWAVGEGGTILFTRTGGTGG